MAQIYAAAVVTVSDRVSRGDAEDTGGPAAARKLQETGRFNVVERHAVADEREPLSELLTALSARVSVIVTTGGTGLSARDVTPEATADVVERRVPGMEEAMRAEGRSKTPLAVLSRAIVGVRGSCLIINLPGSPKGIEDGLRALLPSLPHAAEVLRREISDCAPARAPYES